MENNLNAVKVGISENVLIELHCLLLVAAEEIHLYSLHSYAPQPRHFTVTRYGSAHAVAWCLRCIVLAAVAVIPQHQRHSALLGIAAKLGNAVAPDALVPPVVNQSIFKAHLRGKVYELHLVIVVY